MEVTTPCEDMDLLLAAYVDGVAVPDDRRAVEAHIAGCDACRQALAEEAAMRRALAAHGRAMAPMAPPGLSTRVAAMLADELASPLSAGWGVRLSAFAAAAVLVLAVSAVALPVVTGRSSVVLAAQLALDHLKCFLIEPHAHGETVTVADAQAELKREYGWDLTVPPSAGAAGGQLVAVRRCLYGEGRAAHLLYSVNDQPVSLFILPGVEHASTSISVLGQDEVIWTQNGRTYMLVGAAGAGDQLRSMASNLQNGAE